jgi:tetratricopeptide (TPR) repeat protein
MDTIAELEERLVRYPADRYPVQHATTQFHLGLELTNAGRPGEAEQALRIALSLFEPTGLDRERGKTLNALGAALRAAGRPAEAATEFSEAAEVLEGAERGAALYNLGLVRRECGDDPQALVAFERARDLFDAGSTPAEAGAAGRELGATLLRAGDVASAISALERSLDLAEGAGDEDGLGAAANALGLAHLAEGRTGEAVDALRRAIASHPRSIRPQAHAMAKANLALAYEQAGDAPRARLAAGQALGVNEAPEAVVEQARALLSRLGRGDGDLFAVLQEESRERWPALVREEVVRWVDAEDRVDEVAAWIDGILENPDDAVDLAEAWFAALLELPTAEMETVIAAALNSVRDRDANLFRLTVDSASARFHTPQLLRLREALGRTWPET